jgi:hypothetical protein
MPPDPQAWALAQSRQPGLSALRGPDGGPGLMPPGDTTPPAGGDRQPFFGRLLSAGVGGQYSFVEVVQDQAAPASWVTVPGGVVGPATGPGGAWHPGGVTTLPTDATAGAGLGLVALLWPTSGDYGSDFAIVGAGSPSGAGPRIDLVTNVCPLSPSGFRVEYTPVTLPPGSVLGKPFCLDNPSDCCSGTGTGTGTGSGSGAGAGGGTVSVPCSSSPVPATLHLTMHNVSGFACLDGVVVPLVYEAVGLGQWWAHNVPVGTDNLGGILYFDGYMTCGTCLSGGCSDSAHNWGLACTIKEGTAANAPTNSYSRDSTAAGGSFTQSPFVVTFDKAGTYPQNIICTGFGTTGAAINFTVTP